MKFCVKIICKITYNTCYCLVKIPYMPFCFRPSVIANQNTFLHLNNWLFQTALSLRESIEAWNKGTNRWLRMIVYERVEKNRTILTYALSALWHGFYPGYYLTFANGAFFTFVARTVSIFPLSEDEPLVHQADCRPDSLYTLSQAL